MTVAENLLFFLARSLYNTDVAHSSEMKDALENICTYDAYRAAEVDRVLQAVNDFGISISNRAVMDFGCNDGALSVEYIRRGAARVIGVDIDERAIERAKNLYGNDRLTFLCSTANSIPLPDGSIDAAISYDVFEHVSRPGQIAGELNRVLVAGGKALIGTWGWYHPFAPHLWSVMPVPWAHVFFGERTMLRVCRRVYDAPWYRPNMHDYDKQGEKRKDKFSGESISTDYLNKLRIAEFEEIFRHAGFSCNTSCIPFGSRYANWTRVFLHLPWFREFLSGYVWFSLTRKNN